jgi:AhpC/TSA family protein
MAQNPRQGIYVTLICLSILLSITAMSALALQVGDKAPDFLLHSTVGETLRLSDYHGKKNIVLFFFVRAFGGV